MGSVVLVRHSTTQASKSGRNAGSRSDRPLSAEGVALAAELAAALRLELRELPHDDIRLISSPARRCTQTAEALRAMFGGLAGSSLGLEVEPTLHEIDYGEWEGLTGEECWARDPELRAAWEADPFGTRCPAGESGRDVARRSFPTLEAIEAWAGAARSRCAVVVAHNHVNRLRICALLGWPMHRYRDRVAQDPAGYSLITLGPIGTVVRRLNATPAAGGKPA